MSAAKGSGGTASIGYDVATALWQGKRPYQEDTLLADFHGGMDRGFAVLADGMGGHAAGDLASRLVVIDAVSHLKFLMHDGATLEENLQAELTSAIDTANDVLRDRAAEDRRLKGMGATFLATVMFEDRLYWASVGDSPLYLWREGKLRQLNEDHSMAPVIDQMAKSGEITEEEAANHPDRNALTSVLMGGRVKSTDVPKMATVLDPGDVLIQASDGLQYLDEAEIVTVLERVGATASSRQIADHLMAALHKLDDPTQDNTAILVLQLTEGMAGGGGGDSAATSASSALERAVEASKAGAASAAAAGPSAALADAPADAAPRAETPGDVPRPSGGRRWVMPAALLGGAALALGLIFGLPSEQDATDTALGTPQPGTSEPVADVSVDADAENADPNPVAAEGGDPQAEAGVPADADSADIPDAEEPAAEAAEPAVTEEILIDDGPSADPAEPETAADPEGPEPGAVEPDATEPEPAEAEIEPAQEQAPDAADPDDGPAPDEGAAAEDEAAAPAIEPQRSGDEAQISRGPAPRPDTTAPEGSVDAAADGAGEAPETGLVEEVAEPQSPVDPAAAAPLNGNDIDAADPAEQEAVAAPQTGAATAGPSGGSTTGVGITSVIDGTATGAGAATASGQPTAPAPAPVPTPAPSQPPALPQAGGTPMPGQIVPTPGIGRLNETMNAPAGAPVPGPVPAPDADAAPEPRPGQRPLLLPEEEEVNAAPTVPSTEGQRANLMAPGPPLLATPGQGHGGAGAAPSLPPLSYGIQRVCQRHRCFAIITRPGSTSGHGFGPVFLNNHRATQIKPIHD